MLYKRAALCLIVFIRHAVSGQCIVQLHSIRLQEFACICLYSVIKGFLGPEASEWQTPLALESRKLDRKSILNQFLEKLRHFLAIDVLAAERTGICISLVLCMCQERQWCCHQALFCRFNWNISKLLDSLLSEPPPLKEQIVAENLCIPLVITEPRLNTTV